MRKISGIIAVFTMACLTLAPLANAKDNSAYEKKEFAASNGLNLPYRLLSPEKVEDGKKYPLVIFLHGAGERGSDNDRQLHHFAHEFIKIRAEYPCFVVAPQCPQGKQWVDVKWGAPTPHKLPEKPSVAMSAFMELLPVLEKGYPIDPKRIYVIGLSMGGFGTWDIICRMPDKFAAAVPICGGADDSLAKTIAKIPLWVWHGDKDQTVKTIRSQSMVQALKDAGGAPKYTELPNTGHNSWTKASLTPELYEWLFSQHK